MNRRINIIVVIIGLIVFIGFDSIRTPPDPYLAPDPFAFGSNEGASNAICSLSAEVFE